MIITCREKLTRKLFKVLEEKLQDYVSKGNIEKMLGLMTCVCNII